MSAPMNGTDQTLLIVDDDKPFLTRLARAMETRGYLVDTAESVEEAVSKARQPERGNQHDAAAGQQRQRHDRLGQRPPAHSITSPRSKNFASASELTKPSSTISSAPSKYISLS